MELNLDVEYAISAHKMNAPNRREDLRGEPRRSFYTEQPRAISTSLNPSHSGLHCLIELLPTRIHVHNQDLLRT